MDYKQNPLAWDINTQPKPNTEALVEAKRAQYTIDCLYHEVFSTEAGKQLLDNQAKARADGLRVKLSKGEFEGGTVAVDTAGDDSYIHWQLERNRQDREVALRRKRIKEEEITRLRLEAQEIVVKKAEIKNDTTKQAERQMRALEKEYSTLMAEIRQQLILLEQLQQKNVKARQSMILLLMAAGNPFGRFN